LPPRTSIPQRSSRWCATGWNDSLRPRRATCSARCVPSSVACMSPAGRASRWWLRCRPRRCGAGRSSRERCLARSRRICSKVATRRRRAAVATWRCCASSCASACGRERSPGSSSTRSTGVLEIVVEGKSRRPERLPLPVDVGEAIAAYLRDGRPRVTGRGVFLQARAPHRALSRCGLRSVVYSACDRCGAPRFGPHRLRHTLGTESCPGRRARRRQGAARPRLDPLDRAVPLHPGLDAQREAVERLGPLVFGKESR